MTNLTEKELRIVDILIEEKVNFLNDRIKLHTNKIEKTSFDLWTIENATVGLVELSNIKQKLNTGVSNENKSK
jgi:hypothetical protein